MAAMAATSRSERTSRRSFCELGVEPSELVPQARLESRPSEPMSHFDEGTWDDALARHGEFTASFTSERHLERDLGYREKSWPVQYPPEGACVFTSGDRVRRHSVDGSDAALVDHRPVVDVREIVDVDPGEPLVSRSQGSSKAGFEDRPLRPERTAAR